MIDTPYGGDRHSILHTWGIDTPYKRDVHSIQRNRHSKQRGWTVYRVTGGDRHYTD